MFCAAACRMAALSLPSLSPNGVVAGLGAAVGDPTGTRRAAALEEEAPEEDEDDGSANGVVACLSAAATASAALDSSGPRPSGVLAADADDAAAAAPPPWTDLTTASGCSVRAARGSESRDPVSSSSC